MSQTASAGMSPAEFAQARIRMVEAQLRRRGISDPLVLKAMGEVPREAFVPPGFEEFSYEDSALPIEQGQTISQPFMVALMLQAAALGRHDRVLEVGAGSGYAAAVAGHIAGQVFTIERHRALAEAARARLRALGLTNIALRHGDGTKGWPEAAPFDAILVAAAGLTIPQALKDQLAIGGRLIIPTGSEGEQLLKRITRSGEEEFQQETLAAVRFVPLVEDADSLTTVLRATAEPLPALHEPSFAQAFDRFGDRRVVLLGEASHGTSEFYRARAAITAHLIREHGFDIVAVEADWPDAAAVNSDIAHAAGARRDAAFQRFPTWMWRNVEFEGFVEELRRHNQDLPADRRVGFYGLDLYNMRGSIAAVLAYLDKTDPGAAKLARERYGCLMPWQRDPAVYGRVALSDSYRACEEEVLAQCRDLFHRQMADGPAWFDAAQNARLVASAERYYRVMYYGGAESWNLRDTHMFETLTQILEQRGAQSKAVVWAHNSHIGDARHTEMGALRGELNIGQLAREHFGDDAALIGFGTDHGTVMAATEWDGEAQVKTVRPALPQSWEAALHDSGLQRSLLDMSGRTDPALAAARLERFIGVIYRPESERLSHYADAALARQFDAYVWFDRTEAVTPLESDARAGMPDTYPFGM